MGLHRAVVLVLPLVLAACATTEPVPAGERRGDARVEAPIVTLPSLKPGVRRVAGIGEVLYRELEGPVAGALVLDAFAAGPAFGSLRPLAAQAPLRRAVVDGIEVFCAERRAYADTAPMTAISCFSDSDGDQRFDAVVGLMQPEEGLPERFGPVPLAAPLRFTRKPYSPSAEPHAVAILYDGVQGDALAFRQVIEGPLPDETMRSLAFTMALPAQRPAPVSFQIVTTKGAVSLPDPLVWRPEPLILRVHAADPARIEYEVARGFTPWRLDLVAAGGRVVLSLDYLGEPEIERMRRLRNTLEMMAGTPPAAASPVKPVPTQ